MAMDGYKVMFWLEREKSSSLKTQLIHYFILELLNWDLSHVARSHVQIQDCNLCFLSNMVYFFFNTPYSVFFTLKISRVLLIVVFLFKKKKRMGEMRRKN